MNHRNSQSGRENPFSKKGDGDTSNLSTNHVNDHPSPFNFFKMEQEEKKEPKVNKVPQRNQSLITGKIGDKIISIPLIYPPPKVESKQVEAVGKNSKRSVPPSNMQIDETPVLKDVEQEKGVFGKNVSKGESEREENVSLLEEEFSSLLEESPSLIKEPPLILETSSELTEESDPLLNELFLMLDEESESNSSILEETESIDDMIAEKVIAMLDDEDDDSLMEGITSLFETESPSFPKEDSFSLEEESTVSVKANFFSLDEESAPTEDNSLLLKEESPSQLEWDSLSTKKEFTLFSEEEDSLSVEEESPPFREKNSISLEEESSHFLDADSSLDNQESPSFEEENAEPLKEESMAEKEKNLLFEDVSDLNFNESSSYQDEFSMMLEKAATHEEEDTSSSDKKKIEVLTKHTDDTPSRRVKENAQREKSPSQSDKKGSDQEESRKAKKNAQWEKSSSQTDKNVSEHEEPIKMMKSSLLLEELCSQLEESSSHQSESNGIDYYKEEESPILDDIFPKCIKGKKAQIEERFEEELLKEEEESEDQCPRSSTEESKHECEQEHGPTVKLPVVLAKLLVDINIFETVDLPVPIESVSKVEWSLQSYQCKVILPSTTVFLKGVLVADVEFKENGMKTVQTLKIPVSWSKTTKVEWLHSPKMPSKSQKEYIFTSENGEDITTHYEFTQEFADEIDAEIRVVHFSINEEFHSGEGQTQFDLQGSVTLFINLLQERFINLKN